jgi:hypothetical protein
MKRWSGKLEKPIEVPKIDSFIGEILEVCKKHGFSISHEDCHGGFLICKYSDRDAEWLMTASDETEDITFEEYSRFDETGFMKD